MSRVDVLENARWSEEIVRARYAETDQMGHVYYANYLVWMEISRGAWLRDRGLSYTTIEEMGYFTPVVEVGLKYRREIRYDEEIIVRARLVELRRASFRYEYQLVGKEDGAVRAEGFTWQVMMGRERKAVTVPEAIREMLLRP